MKRRPNLTRYAYEHAVERLDEYAKHHASAQFRRSYQRLLFLVECVASCDYSAGRRPDEAALAHAWEDVQVAFAGCGDWLWMGVICLMWKHCGDEIVFGKVVRDAFTLAESYTAPDVARRYMIEARNRPFVNPLTRMACPDSVIPLWGATLEDFAADTNHDFSALYANWAEFAPSLRKGGAVSEKPKKPQLTLVVNNLFDK